MTSNTSPLISTQAVINKIIADYHNDSTELNINFFDINVKMSEKDLVTAYIEIQNKINGDLVAHLSDATITPDNHISGTTDPIEYYTDEFFGSYKDFLEQFAEKNGSHGGKTGWFRITDPETDPRHPERLVDGVVVPLIL